MPTISNLQCTSLGTNSASGTFNWSADCATVQARTDKTGDTLTFTPFAGGSGSWSNTGLASGVTVRLDAWGFDASNNKGPETTIFYTTLSNSPPGGTSGISATAVNQRSPKLMNVFWNSVSGATGYRLYKNSGSGWFPYTSGSSDGDVGNVTSKQVTVDYEWQYYQFRVIATNVYGNGPNVDSGSFKSNDSYAPVITSAASVSSKTANSITINASAVDGTPDIGSASGIGTAKLYLNGGLWSTVSNSGSGPFAFTGLSSGTTYTLGVEFLDNNATPNVSSRTSTSDTTYFADTTAPTVGETYSPTATTINAAWFITDVTGPADDIESGFNQGQLFMSGAGGGTRNLKLTTFAANSNNTFSTDGNGAAILSNTTYYFHWVLTDNAGNSRTTSAVPVTTITSRPSNFAWDTAKTAGANFSITASEWIRLQNAINAFRSYKGLGAYSFSVAAAGFDFTANHYNEARNAIFGMNGSIPPFHNPGEDILASEIDALRTSLNAVT